MNIIRCFVSNTVDAEWNEIDKKLAFEEGRNFRTYLWGEYGICNSLESLKYDKYGNDLIIILFQFYIKPIPYLIENLKEIEPYRKKEKSIGISIIITDDNFFSKSEEDRIKFLKKIFIQKLEILEAIINQKKLDTNISLLKNDLDQLLNKI